MLRSNASHPMMNTMKRPIVSSHAWRLRARARPEGLPRVTTRDATGNSAAAEATGVHRNWCPEINGAKRRRQQPRRHERVAQIAVARGGPAGHARGACAALSGTDWPGVPGQATSLRWNPGVSAEPAFSVGSAGVACFCRHCGNF